MHKQDSMKKIESTTDYARFKFMPGNRPVGARVASLIKSIKRRNQLANYPIVCRNERGKLLIGDGQHRFSAARALGLPIFWIEDPKLEIGDVTSSNAQQKAWAPMDYIASFAMGGNKNYIILKEFIEEFHLPPATSAALVAGKVSYITGGQDDLLKDGNMIAKGLEHARRVARLLLQIGKYFPHYRDRSFVIAITRLLDLSEFDPKRFLHKLEYQVSTLVRSATWPQYVDLIEKIYNYRSKARDIEGLSIAVRKAMGTEEEHG